MKHSISLFITIILTLGTIFSQSPQAFQYQAIARDDEGEIIKNQSVSLKISLLAEDINGDVVYSETHQVETNTFGLINLVVGNGTVETGSFSSINWSKGNVFLKVDMDATGGEDYHTLGTSQLLSVPFALHANQAEQVTLTSPGGEKFQLAVDDNGNLSTEKVESGGQGAITKNKVSGFVQKGPYVNGSALIISELNQDMNATGRNFNTQVQGNSGTFEISNMELESPYVELRADGFYFDEVKGEKSTAQLTLYTLSDVTNINTVNVNVLSYLEKGRIEYLISEGKTFEAAKKQAQQEILSIFEIEKEDIANSELLDISKSGDDNAILLAVSVILQGYRSVGELSELLANISTDIRTDGELNSESTGTKLITHTKYLNLTEIRNNLENRYSDLGLNTTIPGFEKFIHQFIDNSDFSTDEILDFPTEGANGINILHPDITTYKKQTKENNKSYSLAVNLPENFSLKIKMKGGDWAYSVSSVLNWSISDYDYANQEQSFTSFESGKKCDLKLYFFSDDPITIEYYINNSDEPTFTKTLSCNSYILEDSIPKTGQYGKNILGYLSREDTLDIISNKEYSIAFDGVSPSSEINLECIFTIKKDMYNYQMDTNRIEGWNLEIQEYNDWDSDTSHIKLRYNGPPRILDMPIMFSGNGTLRVMLKEFISNHELWETFYIKPED